MPLPLIRGPNEAALLRWFFENPRKLNYAFRLREESGIAKGSVPRAITNLCVDGWLVPVSVPGRRSPRLMYALSGEGQDQVASALAEWDAWTKKAGVTRRYPRISGTALPRIRGSVQAAVLRWFSENPGEKNYASALGRGLDIGRDLVFRALQSLCKGGWLDDAGKELRDGCPCRMFGLSDAGKRHVDAALAQWEAPPEEPEEAAQGEDPLVRALEDAVDAVLKKRDAPGTLQITVEPKDGGRGYRFNGYVIVPGPGDREERLPSPGERPAQGEHPLARALKKAVADELGTTLVASVLRRNKDGSTVWRVRGVVTVGSLEG